MLHVEGIEPSSAVEPATLVGWRVGTLEVDRLRSRVLRGARPVALDVRDLTLLLFLVEHAGKVAGKDDLLRVGWPGRVVSENSLAKAIGKLRVALGDEGALIRAVHGYGYRLDAEVEPIMRGLGAPAQAPVAAPASVGDTPLHMTVRSWRRWALVLLLALVAGWASLSLLAPAPPASTRATTGNEDVIAILPLRDGTTDGSLAVLADGISNHLRDQVQRLSKLRIISRAESHAHRHADGEPARVAAELGANLIIGGEISRRGDRLLVELSLFDASGRMPAWRRQFERSPLDQATLLDDLTQALLSHIGNHPDRWGAQRPRGRGTTNPQAHATFLRAATLFGGNNDPNSQRRTIAVLEQALALDPDYVDALIMLGGILGGSGYYADSTAELVSGRRRALDLMDRGIALDPDDPGDYLLRSEMRLLYAFDWQGAQADIDAALARTPANEAARVLVWQARFVASMGRIDEAIAIGARANALDPEAGGRRNQGWHYLAAGDTRNARAVLMLQLVDLPENPHSNFYLALCDIFEGQPADALPRLELSSTLFRLVGTAIAQHELGDRAASDLALGKLIDQFAIADGYWVGAAYAWRGELDLAFHWLERALEGGDSSIMYLPFDPLLHRLRDDPRYSVLQARLKLPSR